MEWAVMAMIGVLLLGPVSCVGMCVVLIVSAYVGMDILKFFDVSIASFQVVGGFIVGIIAYSMLKAQPAFSGGEHKGAHSNPGLSP